MPLRCDPVPPEAYRRHWKHEEKVGAWHIIADGSDFMGRLPRPANFVTVLSYRLDQGGSAHYQGPMYFEFDAMNPADAFPDLRRCLPILEVEYGCPVDAVRVWHSGGRGFHGKIPPVVFGAEAEHPQLPHIYAAMIDHLFPAAVAPTLDRSVYSARKGRMWRLPNRQRNNGRYKVPLAMREVLHRPYAELEALTMRPRMGRYWPDEEELSPCPGLVALYRAVITRVRDVTPTSPARHDEGRIPEGQRNATLASLAGSMRRRGASEEAIAAALQAENRVRCEPPLPDEEVGRIAASVARYAPANPANDDHHHPLLGARYLAREVTHG